MGREWRDKTEQDKPKRRTRCEFARKRRFVCARLCCACAVGRRRLRRIWRPRTHGGICRYWLQDHTGAWQVVRGSRFLHQAEAFSCAPDAFLPHLSLHCRAHASSVSSSQS
eukprot:4912040-Pleurochrysis_carterae.AAC.14